MYLSSQKSLICCHPEVLLVPLLHDVALFVLLSSLWYYCSCMECNSSPGCGLKYLLTQNDSCIVSGTLIHGEILVASLGWVSWDWLFFNCRCRQVRSDYRIINCLSVYICLKPRNLFDRGHSLPAGKVIYPNNKNIIWPKNNMLTDLLMCR